MSRLCPQSSSTAYNPVVERIVQDWDLRASRTADFGSLGLLTFAAARESASTPQGLHALAVEAAAGSEAARHTVLRVMLPKAVRLSRTCRGLRNRPHDEATNIAVACLWNVIGNYRAPAGSLDAAGRLSLAALKLVTATCRPNETEHEVPCDPHRLATYTEQSTAEGPEGITGTGTHSSWKTEATEQMEQMLHVLEWAVKTPATTGRGMVLSAEDAKLLGQWVISTTTERQQICTDRGKSYACLERRVFRMRDRLAAEVSNQGLNRAQFA